MSNTRYKPRLKKGILENKRFMLLTKKLEGLRKRKWQTFLKNFKNRQSTEPFIRNDVLLIQNKLFDLRKSYKKALLLKQQTSSFFSTFSRKDLRNIFSSSLPITTICDLIEMRLDMVLVRSKLVKTLNQARWCIASGFVLVNNTPVKVHSHPLSIGDLICLRQKDKNFFNSAVFNLPSDHLEVNYNTLSVVIVNRPNFKSERDLIKFYHFFIGLDEITNFDKVN